MCSVVILHGSDGEENKPGKRNLNAKLGDLEILSCPAIEKHIYIDCDKSSEYLIITWQKIKVKVVVYTQYPF